MSYWCDGSIYTVIPPITVYDVIGQHYKIRSIILEATIENVILVLNFYYLIVIIRELNLTKYST